MAEFDSLTSENRDLARRINQEARQNPDSPYAGKCVGIANGKVVAVADTWREVADRLREVEQDPKKCCCVEASADYEALHEIWSVVSCR
ncbi:MAG: hypothetical protein H8E44_02120 [Planctomycetes bacterium]|nr:hypothetical protein [Planctomycetota bacterium]